MNEAYEPFADQILIYVQTGGRPVTLRPRSPETTGRVLACRYAQASVGLKAASKKLRWQGHLFLQ